MLLRQNLIDHVNIQVLIPLLLDMKCTNTIKLPLVSKQDILKQLPHSLTRTLARNGDINVLDLINADETCPYVVKSKACFDQVRPLIEVLRRQWYPKSSKTALESIKTNSRQFLNKGSDVKRTRLAVINKCGTGI